jgi:hypothetical protein
MTTDDLHAPKRTANQPTLLQDLGSFARYHLRDHRVLIIGGIIVAAAGIALGRNWLAAIGILPLILALAPCAAMCALGLCMMPKSKQLSANSEPGAAGTDLAMSAGAVSTVQARTAADATVSGTGPSQPGVADDAGDMVATESPAENVQPARERDSQHHLASLARRLLRNPRVIILGGIVLAAGGIILGRSWLAAIGLLPLILAVAPCALMCALGLCAMPGSKQTTVSSESDHAGTGLNSTVGTASIMNNSDGEEVGATTSVTSGPKTLAAERDKTCCSS